MYRYYATLMIRGEGKKETIRLHGKEGVTQSVPLIMVGYRFVVLRLIGS